MLVGTGLVILLSRSVLVFRNQLVGALEAKTFMTVISWCVYAFILLPSALFSSHSVLLRPDFGYVLDEVIGPLVGHAPLSTSIPQYLSLLGWPLMLVSGLSNGTQLEIAILWISILGISMCIGVAYFLHFCVKEIKFVNLLILATLMFVMRPPGVFSGSLVMFPSSVSRLLAPVLVMCVIVKLRFFRTPSFKSGLIVGFASALGALNNFEFGSVTFFSLLFSISFACFFFRKFSVTLVSFLLGVSVIFVVF